MPSRRFAVLFESVILDFLEGHRLDATHLRLTYLKVMSPGLRNVVLPNIVALNTWRVISNAAISIEESIFLRDSLLEDAFAILSLEPTPAIVPLALASCIRDADYGACSLFLLFRHVTKLPPCQQHPMCCWSESGKPICDHCKKEDNLRKKCRGRHRHAITNIPGDASAIDKSRQASGCYSQHKSFRTLLEEKRTLFLTRLDSGRTPVRSIQLKAANRWPEGMMKDSGINAKKFKAHSLRSTASTDAVSLGVPLEKVKLHANWSLMSNMVEKYYYRPRNKHERGSDIVNTVFGEVTENHIRGQSKGNGNCGRYNGYVAKTKTKCALGPLI
ncbi:hypothetical protein RMATCC62417_16895 [Rhizopus microsporus]|nr:hypothetical protein RMATCC62417_16895 [Rhizopus microsporus]